VKKKTPEERVGVHPNLPDPRDEKSRGKGKRLPASRRNRNEGIEKSEPDSLLQELRHRWKEEGEILRPWTAREARGGGRKRPWRRWENRKSKKRAPPFSGVTKFMCHYSGKERRGSTREGREKFVPVSESAISSSPPKKGGLFRKWLAR